MLKNIRDNKVSIKLDRERHFNFSFNTLAEIEELFKVPFLTVLKSFDMGDTYTRLALFYVSLKQEDKGFSLDKAALWFAKKEQEAIALTTQALIEALPDPPQGGDTSDTFSWEWFYFIARIEFNLSDEEFWSMTFRKFDSLIRQKIRDPEAEKKQKEFEEWLDRHGY